LRAETQKLLLSVRTPWTLEVQAYYTSSEASAYSPSTKAKNIHEIGSNRSFLGGVGSPWQQHYLLITNWT